MKLNIEFMYNNLDKLFNINFTMLAFMIAALTILQMLQTGRIEEFRKLGLFDNVVKYFHYSLIGHSMSGLVILILWFLQLQEYLKTISTVFSFIFFFISFYYTYQAYKFLVYFVKKQTK